MESLYELTQECKALLAIAEDPETDYETLLNTFEGLQMEIEQKAVSTAYVLNRMDANITVIGDEIDRLTDLLSTYRNSQKQLKAVLLEAMKTADIKKVDADPRFKIIRKKNGGKAPLIITGEVPQSFMKIVYEQDNALIRKKLEAGEELDFAHIGESGEHIEIK